MHFIEPSANALWEHQIQTTKEITKILVSLAATGLEAPLSGSVSRMNE